MPTSISRRMRRLLAHHRRQQPTGILDPGEILPPAEWVALVRAWHARPTKGPVGSDEYKTMIEAARSAPADLDDLEVRTDGY